MRPTTARQGRVLGALAAAAFALAACSSGGTSDATDTQTTAATPARTEVVSMVLTFDGKTCAYDGETEFTAGPVVLDFSNNGESGRAAGFLAKIDEGYTIQDAIDQLGPEPSSETKPDWQRDMGAGEMTMPGDTHHWEGNLDEGLYFLVCYRGAPVGVWSGAGLTVTG
jgi:hypothetical protein